MSENKNDNCASDLRRRTLLGITNVTFGGPDLKTLYMMLSRTGQLASMPGPGLKLAYS